MKEQTEALRMAANYLEMIRKVDDYIVGFTKSLGKGILTDNDELAIHSSKRLCSLRETKNRITPRYNYWLEKAKI